MVPTMAHLVDRAQSAAGYTTPEVSPSVFLGAICAMTALSFIFLPIRFYARWKTVHHFSWDDLAVAFAWILSLAITIAVAIFRNVVYQVMQIGSGRVPFPPNVKTITMQFTRLFVIIPMVFYTGLWSVKLAFLLFFWRLGTRSMKSIRRWWYIVTATTGVSFMLCFATLPYRCTLISFEITASSECATQGLSFVSMGVNCALDVFTDLLIMSIPFLILRHVRITRRQRLALAAVFSLVIVTIAFAIIRATITTVGVEQQIDPIWMYLWTSIELNVAIIVACVAPFRKLFLRERDPRMHARRQPLSLKQKAFRLFSSSGRSFEREDENLWSSDDLPYLAPWPNDQNSSKTNTKHDSGMDSKTRSQVHHCQDPWMTADLPYLEPWHESEAQTRVPKISNSEAIRSVPPVHLNQRLDSP